VRRAEPLWARYSGEFGAEDFEQVLRMACSASALAGCRSRHVQDRAPATLLDASFELPDALLDDRLVPVVVDASSSKISIVIPSFSERRHRSTVYRGRLLRAYDRVLTRSAAASVTGPAELRSGRKIQRGEIGR